VSVSSWLVARPWAYNLTQRLAGLDIIKRRVAPILAATAGKTVLDVGAGTALYLTVLPQAARYVWLDNDPQKLRGFQGPVIGKRRAVIGDAVNLGLRDRSVDCVLCLHLTHHLDDTELARLVDELARVVRQTLIFQDAVKTRRLASRLLWRWDRGSHPRDAESLMAALRTRFEIERAERYSTLHEYLLIVAVPRRVVSAGLKPCST